MKKIYRKIYVILIIFCVSIPFAKAQKTMQYMYQLPQVNNINPAMQPECNGFFTLPGLSGANIAFGSPLSYDNIFKKHPEYSDSILFDFDKILAKIKDVEILKGKEPEDGWQLTFDWLLIEKNYRSILDGTFDPFSARYNLNMDDHLLPEKRIRGDYGQELNAVGELLEDEHNKKIFEFDPQLFFDKAEVLEQFRELITSVHGSPATVEKFKEEKSRRENSLNKKIRSGKKFKLKKSEAEKSLN